jgi:hypothetical protein
MDAMRETQAGQLDRVRSEARQDVENERAKLERERERYQAMTAQAIAESARLKGRLEALQPGNGARPSAKRAKSSPDGAASGDDSGQ